jgi:tetratricopeptide (TPR) repeat protein
MIDEEIRKGYLQQAQTALERKWFDEVDSIGTRYPEDFEFLKIRIEAERIQNKFPQSIQLVNSYLQKDPDNVWMLTTKGGILMDMKQDNLAEDILKKSLSINPHFPMTHFYLGSIKQRVSRWKEAKLYFDKTIELDPKAWYALGHRAMCYWFENNINDALVDISTAINLNPFYELVYELKINILFDLKDFENALDTATVLVQINPEDGRHYCRRGGILIELNRLEEAKADFKTALDKGVSLARKVMQERGWL